MPGCAGRPTEVGQLESSADQTNTGAFQGGAGSWQADPLGRHQHRWWDGTVWTDHVSDAGRASIDPLQPAPPAPATPSDAPTALANAIDPSYQLLSTHRASQAVAAPSSPAGGGPDAHTRLPYSAPGLPVQPIAGSAPSGTRIPVEVSRFCIMCGSGLEPDDGFCLNCGASTDPTLLADGVGDQPTVPPSHVRRRSRVFGLVATGLVVVAVGLGVGWWAGDGTIPSWVPFGQSDGTIETAATVTTATPAATPENSTTTDQSTTAPTSTTTTGPTTTTTLVLPEDLGLSVPMTKPDCDGSFATFIGASVEPLQYAQEIDRLLQSYPGSSYLRTDITCASLRPVFDNGEAIYAVYFGPYGTFREACDARSLGPSSSYVKPLDNFSDPNELPDC